MLPSAAHLQNDAPNALTSSVHNSTRLRLDLNSAGLPLNSAALPMYWRALINLSLQPLQRIGPPFLNGCSMATDGMLDWGDA